MKTKRVTLISILNILIVNFICGQYEKVNEEIIFQSRLDNPVKIEVLEQNGKYVYMFHDADRISGKQSLEIMHKDGTIMIYENLDPTRIYTKPGHIVYPGQPLGIINDKSILEVYLYMIQKDNKLQSLNIYYYLDGDKVDKFSEDFRNIKIVHSKDILMKEMTKREKTQFKNL